MKVWIIMNDFDRCSIGVCGDEVKTEQLLNRLNGIPHGLYPTTNQFFSQEYSLDTFESAYTSDIHNSQIAQIWKEVIG